MGIMGILKPRGALGRMLVLSRKTNEQIVIHDNIVITVVAIRGDKVRLGIEAPTDIPVHRRGVYDAIQLAEKQEADRAPTDEMPAD
jgi:carbon storage regulator